MSISHISYLILYVFTLRHLFSWVTMRGGWGATKRCRKRETLAVLTLPTEDFCPELESRWVGGHSMRQSWRVYWLQVFNLSLAYALAFIVSNVPYVIFELAIAFQYRNVLSQFLTAIIGIISNIKFNTIPTVYFLIKFFNLFSGILPALNSALNPFIYLMFNSQIYCLQVPNYIHK